MNRKQFIKNATLTAASFTMLSSGELLANKVGERVEIILSDVGLRGQNHLDLLLRRNDIELVAICDIDERMLSKSKEMIAKSGMKMPQIFTGDPYAWKKMSELKDIDGVIIATPWEWHN